MDTTRIVRDQSPTASRRPPRGHALDLRQAGPTVPRMALGARLRRLREERGLTRDEAGAALGVSRSKISRLELGRTGCKQQDVEALLELYGAGDETERAMVRELARQANTPGWWQQYSDVIPSWLHDYLGLEQAAEVIRGFESQFVPGLLQTPDYARAVARLGHPEAPPAELDRRVELRVRRQGVLSRPDPPHLWVVLDEAVLHRPVGGRAVLRAQLDHLRTMAALPHVTVQILPFAAGGHGALCGPVTMLRPPGEQLPDVVYLEQLTTAVYPDRPAEVARYWDLLNHLAVDAEPASATPALLTRMRARL